MNVTKKQLQHMRRLFLERTQSTDAMEIRRCALALYKEGGLTREAADKVITEVEAIPRDVTQKEIPPNIKPVPGFYRLEDVTYEVERITEGRWIGYIRVYRLELIDLVEGGTAWERIKLTRPQTTSVLERVFG